MGWLGGKGELEQQRVEKGGVFIDKGNLLVQVHGLFQGRPHKACVDVIGDKAQLNQEW